MATRSRKRLPGLRIGFLVRADSLRWRKAVRTLGPRYVDDAWRLAGIRVPAGETNSFTGGTDGSNPLPSSRQSVSLRNSPPLVRKLPFSAGVRAGAGGAVGRDAQRPANIRSTDGIISGGPYSSTAMPPDVVRNSAGTGPHARSGCLV